MVNNPVNWFEIYVQDINRAKKFYETVLDVKLESLGDPGLPMWSFPNNRESYGTSGALVQYPQKSSGINSTIVYFYCKDCAVEASRVVAAGGKIQRDKISIGQYGFIVLALDTEGNIFGLHSPAQMD